MESLKVIPTTPAVLRRKHVVSAFKVCPLCDGLNLRENHECYVCRWGGEFDYGPHLVSSRLEELISRCPDLATILNYEKSVKTSFWRRFVNSFHQVLRRSRKRLDLRA